MTQTTDAALVERQFNEYVGEIMTQWQPIETAPKDGTRIDLWMVNKDGTEYREPDAYWVSGGDDRRIKRNLDGGMETYTVKRDGWFGPNHDYDGQDGWADEPYYFNNHPRQQKWMGCEPSHWMAIPAGPNGQEAWK